MRTVQRNGGARRAGAVDATYRTALEHAGLTGRHVSLADGRRVHLVEHGDGPTVLHLHGTSTNALSHVPLLLRAGPVRAVAVDRPGSGLAEGPPLARPGYRDAVVGHLDAVMAALDLDRVVLAGASVGGTWALWYALARPERVEGLVLLGAAPTLPGTNPILPLRISTRPLVSDLLQRLVPSTRANVVRFMSLMGEAETIVRHPDLLDNLVANQADRDVAARAAEEFRVVLSIRGWRRSLELRTADLRTLAVPTLLVWGDRDPLGGPEVARRVADAITRARLELLPAGHVPWLGWPDRVADLVSAFALDPPAA